MLQLRTCIGCLKIQACLTETEKANKLLDLLERRDDKMLNQFCEALYATGQKGIVEDLLRPNLAASDAGGWQVAIGFWWMERSSKQLLQSNE